VSVGAGIDCVDGDPVRGELGAEAEHQPFERALARCIGNLAGKRRAARVDDDAPAHGRAHPTAGERRAESEGAADVYLKMAIPLGDVRVEHSSHARVGVGDDQGTERPDLRLGPDHDPLRRVRVAKILLRKRGADAEPPQLLNEFFGLLRTRAPWLVRVVRPPARRRHVPPVLRQRARDGRPDTRLAGRTSDEGAAPSAAPPSWIPPRRREPT
jgi:hypothetical protein